MSDPDPDLDLAATEVERRLEILEASPQEAIVSRDEVSTGGFLMNVVAEIALLVGGIWLGSYVLRSGPNPAEFVVGVAIAAGVGLWFLSRVDSDLCIATSRHECRSCRSEVRKWRRSGS